MLASGHIALPLPLTTPPSARAAARPPPPHAIVDIVGCITQRGGRGCAARCGKLGAELRPRCQPDASTRIVGVRGSPLFPSHPSLPPKCQHTHTRTHTHTVHLIARPGRRNRRSAALAGCAQVAQGCTVCPAETTCGVPAKYTFQPALPYAFTARFHTKSSTVETAELPASFGIIVQNMCIVRMYCDANLLTHTRMRTRMHMYAHTHLLPQSRERARTDSTAHMPSLCSMHSRSSGLFLLP